MLAVPASAVAFTGVTSSAAQSDQNPVQTPINLQVAPRHVQYGRGVTISGTVPAADAGQRVLLQTAARGESSWHSLGAATVGATGRFRARVTPRRTGLLRAVAPATTTAVPASRAAAVSPARAAAPAPQPTVTVGARFTPAHHESAVRSTGPVHVGGKLLPAQPGRRVRLQGRGPHGWHTLTTGRTGSRGGYRLSVSPDAADGQQLRVAFGGDSRNARTTRPAGRVDVLHPELASWYEDAGNTACGFHAGLGVANRTLPCGTKVTFSYGGRTVNAVVDDRGPYAGGREWDLNQNTAAALGFAGVGTVWSSQ
ncbi:MAG TPA: septal ring lytic transglycosylase RlpA family protein [Solirubrobacteraceae bacterium]|nr:septal ring lytic transglycosylase RlpA family protein [Solirubrobacteraceae bacterium]